MSSKSPSKSQSSRKSQEPRYIGVSIQQFLDGADQDAKAGKYDDGTSIKPEVRKALTQIGNSFGETRLRISHYVFCFSRGCFIRVSF
ncbi:MAG: hypothetical protein ACJ74G_22725 [Blastocatellia bacterium]